jgi:ABC-type nitrate/sulfonate/bicarbonate transport system permease component
MIGSHYSSPLFLPKIKDVLDSAYELVRNGMLQKSLCLSFLRITIATLISSIISIPLGLLVTNFKVLDEIITPLTRAIRFIPVTVFYPLLIMWLGIDEEMKIMFLFIATFFFFFPSVILCFKYVDSNLIDTSYTMVMNKYQVMYRTILPAALPSICQNFIMMYGIGWTYVVIVEVTNAKYGLGYIINLGSARGRTDLVFAAVITILIINWLFDTIGNKIINKVFTWKFAREIDD